MVQVGNWILYRKHPQMAVYRRDSCRIGKLHVDPRIIVGRWVLGTVMHPHAHWADKSLWSGD